MMDLPKEFVTNRPKTAALYGTFFVGFILIYRSLQVRTQDPTGQYDYVLTLSSAFQTLAFALLVLDTRSQVSEGLSEKTLWAFFVAQVSRVSTTIWGEGYAPEDSTADIYLYQILEICGILMVGFKLLKMTTVRTVQDVGQDLDRWQTLAVMIVVSLFLGWYTKSTGHDDYFADLSWMFSVWMEAFALFPQVKLLWASSHIDESAVHFAMCTFASSLAFVGFWWRCVYDKYGEAQGEKDSPFKLFLWGVSICGLIRMCLCASYLYLFLRKTKSFKGALGTKQEYELCLQDEEL
jgi:hypothetical protein